MRTSHLLAVALVSGLLISPVPVAAQTAVLWPVQGKIAGKRHKEKDGYKRSEDVSGIACATASGFPRTCLIVDDESQAVQIVTLQDGRLEAGPVIPVIDDEYQGEPLELDGEGVAFSDGIFYVMGSHGGPRRPKPDAGLVASRAAAASQIVRLKMTPGSFAVLTPLSLTQSIASQPELRDAAKRPLDDNGLTIEGVAVAGDRLYAGFRGPVLAPDRALVLSDSIKGLMGHSPLDPHLFKLPLGAGRGIRDMATYKDQFLILAGPTADAAGRYSIHLWDGKSDTGVRELFDLKTAGIDPERKAEAVLFLDETDRTMRLLVMFDSEKEGTPTVLTVPKP